MSFVTPVDGSSWLSPSSFSVSQIFSCREHASLINPEPHHSRSMAGVSIFMVAVSGVPWLFFLSLLCAILGIAPVGFDRNSATFYSALLSSWFLLSAPTRYYGSSSHPLSCFGLRHFEPSYSD